MPSTCFTSLPLDSPYLGVRAPPWGPNGGHPLEWLRFSQPSGFIRTQGVLARLRQKPFRVNE